jgi:hypothetical protein
MATTEDRLGAYEHERVGTSFEYTLDLAADAVIPENTLVQYDGSVADAATHAAGDDDSGLLILAALAHQEDDINDPLDVKTRRDRGGTDPQGQFLDGVVLALDATESDLSGYALGDTAYAVDNETVSASQADGSAGSYAPAGTVVGFNSADNRVHVHVDGLVN